MRSRTLLLTFGLLLQAAAMQAQIASPCAPPRFLKTLGLPGIQEMGLSLSPAPGSGVYAAGFANDRALISRLDSLGQTLWSRSIGFDTATQLRLFEMITDSEGMIVAVGLEAEGISVAGTAAIAFRYDPTADQILWMKRIQNGIPLNCGILERVPGGNYVFYQTLLPNDTTLLTQVEILELQRNNGNAVPAKSEIISRPTPILFSNLLRWKESLYAVGTQQLATPTGGLRHLLVQLDSSKYQPQWAVNSHLPDSVSAHLVAEDLLIDNDTIVSLYASIDTSSIDPTSLIFLQKTTLTGTLLWVKQYDIPGTTHEAPIDLIQYGNGYAIYGAADSSYFLLGLDHDGNTKNSIRFSNGTAATATFVPFVKGEAYALNQIAYLNGGFAGTDADMALLRTDGQFVADSCGFVQPIDPVIVTPILASNKAIDLQVSPSTTLPQDTSTVPLSVILPEKLLCPASLPPIDTLYLGPDIISCTDTIVLLDAGPGYTTYLWQDSSTAQTFLATEPNIYWVEVTDACGIVQRDSILITVDNSADTQFPDMVICEGDSVALQVPGFDHYQWAPNIGISCDTCASVVISTDTTRTYTLLASSIAGCILRDTFTIQVTYPVASSDTLSACEGDSIIVSGVAYYINGIVTDTLPNPLGGCDTIATHTLQFLPHPTRTVNVQLCQGQSYELNGANYTQNTMVMLSVPAPNSPCDSSILYDIKFTPLPQVHDTLTACANDTIVFGGNTYTANTTVVDTLPATPPACDTLRLTHLVFTPLHTTTDTLTSCANVPLVFGGITYTADTVVLDTLPAATGCDTVHMTVLTFTPLHTRTDTLSSCANVPLVFGGITYTADTVVVDTLSATTGCDTVRTTVLSFTPLHTRTDTLSSCANVPLVFGGITYTADTVVVDTLAAATGCDTVRTTVLTFTPLPVQTDTTLACAGDSITLGGIVFTQDTAIVTDTLAASGAGCDTVLVSQLIFRAWPVRHDTLSACAGDTIIFAGVAYVSDTILLTDTLPATTVGSCDTLVQQVLHFNPLPLLADTMTACEGDTIVFQGVSYVQDTVLMMATLPNNSGGCDTLVTKTLLFFPIPAFTDSLRLCAGDTVSIGGVKYFQDSTLVLSIPAPNGCDTIATYVITVLPRPLLTDTIQACEGDTVTLGGVVYLATTTLLDTLPSTTGGCDTFSRKEIIFLPRPLKNETIKFLPGDTVTLNGVIYTAPVIVKDTIPGTTGGCDTLATYTLQWLTPLTLTCPPDLTVTTAVGDTSTVVDYDLPNANVTCPGGQPTITLLSGLPIGGTFPLGTTEICYTAADTCGNVDTCCFKVTVVEGEMACDVKKNDCFRWEMLPIKLDSLGNRRYRIRVINNCAEKLNYVLFRLPNGIQALEPAEGSTFIPQPSGRKYIVRNPNFSPVYSVRFKADSTTVLSAGTFDIFEYKLPQQSAPTYIYTYAKLDDGSYYEAHLNTFNCPELPWPNFGPNPNDRSQPTATTTMALQLFPNPTDGLLYLQVGGAAGETLRVQVLNATGQSVQEMTLPTAEGPQPLQLGASLDSGLYHIVVRAQDGTVRTERFVLQRN